MCYSAFLLTLTLSSCLAYPMVILKYRQNCPCKRPSKIDLELWELNQFWADSVIMEDTVTSYKNYTWRQINLQRTSFDPWGDYEMEARFTWFCCEFWQPEAIYKFMLEAPLERESGAYACMTADKECKYEITLQPYYRP